jgi:hypothetical protein
MSTFDQALKEFFDNGGEVQTLAYHGPKESDAVLVNRKNVSRETVVERGIDSVVEEIEGLENFKQE